ncbi:DUF6538 domain-containing protein [Lichenifustis flavocetrariae]|uniref:Site-specific integrase n=1 Tax=Lichenifustis flavocetrariae TaxID=2949735 RepID=A0AA41Z7J0_9HYPH|nr:DUF6538 domain-containing protein [Lichenifustis flavocetrariae]MCW6511918.1 site-specific integrase [Lichenifustis flavocetrariae]
MPLMMARPYKHPRTGIYWLRRGVPESLRSLVGKREEKFSLGTRDPEEAKRLHAKAIAEMDSQWANLRAGQRILTEREAHELAKPIFRKWLVLYQDDPGNQLQWHPDLYERLTLLPETDPLSDLKNQGFDNVEEDTAGVHLDELLLANMRVFARAQAKYILEAHGLRVDGYSHLKLVRACAIALQRASLILGDSFETGEPVEIDEELPTANTVTPRTSPPSGTPRSRGAATGVARAVSSKDEPDALTFANLLEAWWTEAKAVGRKPSTYESYRNTFVTFVEFLGHEDAARVTESDVVAFKDHRLSTPSKRTGKPPSAKTVKDSDLSALKTLFGWAVTNRKLGANPATGITIKLAKPQRLRPKWFTDTEAELILSAALNANLSGDAPQLKAAKRWVPWLCAFTGARVGELAQLRKEDVTQRDNYWVVRITPEAGTVKTNEAREVVLHPQIVKLGFSTFVAAAPSGHLFLSPRSDGDVLKPLQTLKNRLAEFGRALVPDEGVAPNHGWRHRFKTVGMEAGIPLRILDAIQGHAPRSVSDSYGDVTLKTMAGAMFKLPYFFVQAKVKEPA